MKRLNVLQTALVGAVALGSAMPAFAVGATFDTADALLSITAMGVAVGLIGAAKLGPAAIAVGFKWLKATIFG